MNTALFPSEAFIRALGWTLMHSLWQGAALALLLLALLSRLESAGRRYRVAYGALLSMLAAACITFCKVFEPASDITALLSPGLAEPVPADGLVTGEIQAAGILEQASRWLEAHYSLIVAIWILGFLVFLIRLVSGLWYVGQLRSRGTSVPDEQWIETTRMLSRRLGMTRTVTLLQSALVHTPMALGWLKPVVLLPVGLVNQLAPAEVEAILAHELAHIARRDWIFNLTQAFIEAIFYYHPAVWWISQTIRRERENCCDDAALKATSNRIAFARALVQVQEMAKPAPLPALALGMSGPRHMLLLERIRRILDQPQQKKSQIMEKFIATVLLLLLLTFVGFRANNSPTLSAAFAQITEVPRTILGFNDQDSRIENDTVPKPGRTRKIIREDDEQRVEAEFRDGELMRLKIDGEDIPESEFDQHSELTSELLRESHPPMPPMPPMPPGVIRVHPPGTPSAPNPPGAPRLSTEKDGEGNMILRFEQNGQPMEIVVKEGEVWVDGQKVEEGETIDLPGVFGSPYVIWDDGHAFGYNFTPGEGYHFEGLEDLADFQISVEDQRRMEEDAKRMQEEALQMNKEQRLMIEQQLREAREMHKEQEKALKEQLRELSLQQKEAMRAQRDAVREMQRSRKLQSKGEGTSAAFKAELQRDGLLADPENYSFQLSTSSLQIDGKKQPDEVHRKYLRLYREKTGNDLGKNGNFSIRENN